MKFTKGVFQSFRATTKVHIGQLGRDIFKDDINKKHASFVVIKNLVTFLCVIVIGILLLI